MSRYVTMLVVRDADELGEVEVATHLDESKLRLIVEDEIAEATVYLDEEAVKRLCHQLSDWLDAR